MKPIEAIAERIVNGLNDADCLSEYSGFAQDHIAEILREELNPSPPSADIVERAKTNLPDFLYLNFDNHVAVGVHGDSVVEDEWIEWIAKQELTSQRWIPVGERLPEKMEQVDVYMGGRFNTRVPDCIYDGTVFCKADTKGSWVKFHTIPTHWMPLPEKPNQSPPSGEK